MVQSIKIYTCNWYHAHTYDKVELKIENSKRECNTHQLSNGENFDHGDEDIFNNKASLNDCFDWPINGNTTMTVGKWGADYWAFCWAKVYISKSKERSNSKGYYYCKNPPDNIWILGDGDNPQIIQMECTAPGE